MALVMRYYSDMSSTKLPMRWEAARLVGVVLRVPARMRQALEGNAALAAGDLMSNTRKEDEASGRMTLLLYIERQLDRARGLEVSAHTQECDTCARCSAPWSGIAAVTRAMLKRRADAVAAGTISRTRAQVDAMIWECFDWRRRESTRSIRVYPAWQQQLEQAGFGGSNLLAC